MAARARLAQFSSQWSSLDPEAISAWNEAAQNFPRNNVFGDQKILSGKNLFTSLNTELLLTGQTALAEPPVPTEITVPTEIIVRSSVGGAVNELIFDVVGTTTGDKVVVRATPPVTAGTSFVKNKLRVVDVVDAESGSTEVDLTASYNAKFGLLPVGAKVFFSAYNVNSIGQRSPEISNFAITVAAP